MLLAKISMAQLAQWMEANKVEQTKGPKNRPFIKLVRLIPKL